MASRSSSGLKENASAPYPEGTSVSVAWL